MQEIRIDNINEMHRYEKYMDNLRALALWITRTDNESSKKAVFDLIKQYTHSFALDILSQNQIPPNSLESFQRSITAVNKELGISEEDIEKASEQQRDRRSGFWEMRRVFGQFGDVAEEAKK